MAKKDTSGKAEISTKTRKMIDAILKPFRAFVEGFTKIAEKREELAPKFIAAYDAAREEIPGLTFVSFCRIYVDSSIPQQSRTVDGKQGYRDHRAYQAADYLRRKAQEMANAAAGGSSNTNKPARSNSMGLARLILSFAAVSKHPDALWLQVGEALGLTNKQIANLQQKAAAAKPLIVMDIKPIDMQVVRAEPATGTAKEEPVTEARARVARMRTKTAA